MIVASTAPLPLWQIALGISRAARFHPLERLKKYCSHFGARIFDFWRGFGEGAGLKNPVTEPKRRQKSKRPLSQSHFPNGYSISLTALNGSKPFGFLRGWRKN